MAKQIFARQNRQILNIQKVSNLACLIGAGLILVARAQALSATLQQNAAEIINPQTVIAKPTRAPTFQWQAMDYYDLTLPSTDAMPYAEIWADKLAQNNHAYRQAGDTRFSIANAPATEADWGIYSPSDEVLITILNTFTCKVLKTDPVGHATLKLCPMRLVEFTHGQRRMFNAPDGCFLEFAKAPPGGHFDKTRDATYAAADYSDKSIRLGTIINHQPVAQCSFHLKVPKFTEDPPKMARGIVNLPQPNAANLGVTK